MKGLLLALGAIALTAGTASASTFVESNTDATLRNKEQDSVVTTIGVGKNFGNSEAIIGVGYTKDTDEAVVRAEYRAYGYINNRFTYEGSVEALYGVAHDNLEVRPELRLRYYID